MDLGEDVEGNVYIYFPQFCGDDVRIYRQRQYGDFNFTECPTPSFSAQNEATAILISEAETKLPELSTPLDETTDAFLMKPVSEVKETKSKSLEENAESSPEPSPVGQTVSNANEVTETSQEDVKPISTCDDELPIEPLVNNVSNTEVQCDSESMNDESILLSPSTPVPINNGTTSANSDEECDMSTVSGSCSNIDNEVTDAESKLESNDIEYSPKTPKKRGKQSR